MQRKVWKLEDSNILHKLIFDYWNTDFYIQNDGIAIDLILVRVETNQVVRRESLLRKSVVWFMKSETIQK